MKNNFKKYTIGTLSSVVAASLLTATVSAQETAKPAQGYTSEQVDTIIRNYIQEESNKAGVPMGLTPGEADALREQIINQGLTTQSYRAITVLARTTTAPQATGVVVPATTMAPVATGVVAPPAETVASSVVPVAPVLTTDDKDDNLDHDVYLDKEIEKDIHSVKFVTLDKSTRNKKVHDFKNEEKDKEEDKVDYSKEPARVGTTPGAAYAIVELEDGIYGQLVADRKSGKKLITVKYNLLKETIEKGSWEYKDEEVVEVKKEEKSEETTTTKSR